MTDGATWCGLCLQAVPGAGAALPVDLGSAAYEAAASTLRPAASGREYLQARSAAEQAWSTMTGDPARSWVQGEPVQAEQVATWLGGSSGTETWMTPQVEAGVYAADVAHAPAEEPAVRVAPYVVAAETGQLAGEHRMVHLTTGERGWVCRICESVQPLAVASCPACATSLFSSVAEKPLVPKGDAGKALLWSIVPGGGQWYLGMHLQAVARASLVALAFVATLSFPGKGGLGALRLAMGLLCAVLWGVSALDARSVAHSGPRAALLDDRRLMWVAMGVTGLLIAAVVLAFLMGSISGTGPTPGG